MKNGQFDIKAIACDFDSTLTDNRARLNLKAVELIRYLEDNGIRVVLNTSRDFMTAGSLSICMGGCGIVSAEDGSVIGGFSDLLKAPMILGNSDKIEKGLQILRQFLGDRLILYNWPGRICSAVLSRVDDFSVEEGNKILNDNGTGVKLLDSGMAYLLVDSCTDKGRGLREIAQMLNLNTENFVAIGDNYNDLPMFAAAGYSIAVGNAPDAVKMMVNYTCQANYGDGFCEAIDHVLNLLKPEWR